MLYDASALLALILDEDGADVATQHLADGRITTVNLAEVMSTLAMRGATADDFQHLRRELPLGVVDFTADMAQAAALLRPKTRALGLSLGDRACLGAATVLGAPVLSGDRAWAKLDRGLGLNVRMIR